MVTQVQDSKPLQNLLQEAMNQTPDGFGIFDPDDRVLFSNPTFAALFNQQPEAIIGQSFADLIRHAHETQRGLNIEARDVEAWIQSAQEKRRVESYRSFQTDTVDGRWLQLTEKMTQDGHMFIFFTDITPQKRAEAKLRELSEQLEQLAQTDELTGINNRRHFMHLASRELSRSLRHGHNATLLVLDIDHFKAINDQYGHDVGDRVLTNFARRVKRELRQYDVFGRLGGEEFAILLPETPLEDAVGLAERLKERVAKMRFIETDAQCQITVSIGAAHQTQENRFLEQLITLADEALYRSKEQGRNKVTAS